MGMRESDTERRRPSTRRSPSMKEDGTLNALIVEWFGEDAQVWE
jgi:polar amino acid transport system substrate-binding protein